MLRTLLLESGASRPAAGPALGLAAVMACSLLTTAPSKASDLDAVFGTPLSSGRPAAPPSLSSRRALGGVVQDEEADARAAYELAVEEIRIGRRAEAQRRLEGLIARHPDSPFADAARAKVVELYTTPLRNSPRSSLGMAPSSTLPPVTGDWRVDVQRGPSIMEDFRAKVGDRVFFAPGSAELGSRARIVLRAQAEWLRQNPGLLVTIEGHADDPGSDGDNRSLAERRADAVRRRLIEEGVPAERLAAAAHGNSRRVALCQEAVCSAQNRRAVSLVREAPARGPVTVRQGAGTIGGERGGMPR